MRGLWQFEGVWVLKEIASLSATAGLNSVTLVFGLSPKLQSISDYSRSQHGSFCFTGLSEMSFLEMEGRGC